MTSFTQILSKRAAKYNVLANNYISNFTTFPLRTNRGYSFDILSASHPERYQVSYRSKFGPAIRICAIGLFFSGVGFAVTAIPVFKAADGYFNPPTDQETLSLFTPYDKKSLEVEEFINNHPLTLNMRSKAGFSESRPHLKIPELQRPNNLTTGPLMGPDRFEVPPFFWVENGGKSLVSILYLGRNLCGHLDIIHGGLLATIIDEGFARCCFSALPNKVGMTANLNVDYRSPTPAGSYVVLRAKTTKVEGRKAWVVGHIETLASEGENPHILAEATALFIEPKQAAAMARLSPVQ